MRQRAILIAAVTTVMLGSACDLLHAQAPTTQTPATLDSLIAKRMADAGIMWLGAAVIANRQVVWTKGYGFADHARSRPFTPGTRRRAYSAPPAYAINRNAGALTKIGA